ncbi:MAG: sigma-70 family RNA polymerase sigma factor [Pseudomonadota bacterium]
MPDREQHQAAALISEIARGDRRALGLLITDHGRRLTMVATRFLGREDEAEEVVQDVFVRVWRHAGSYDPAKAKVSTWLYRIAVNLCIDRQRKRALLRLVGLDDTSTEVPDAQPTAADRIYGAQRLAKVRAAMDNLPSRQRMALLLCAVAELGNSEIADAMGISVGAVEQLLVRARRSLRQISDQDEDMMT